MKRMPILLSLLAALILITSCATMPTMSADPSNPIKSIAVLPLANNTNDVDGPQHVREKLIERIVKRRYSVMPMEEIDRRLRDQLGITLGGQLEDATVEQLKDVLQVDGLVYGTLMDYGEITTGAYNVKKVRAKFKLVCASSGTTIWEKGLGVRSELRMDGDAGTATNAVANIADSKCNDEGVPWVTISNINSNQNFERTLAISLVTKLASKAVGVHLVRETNEMLKRITSNFPVGPGVVVDFGSATENAPSDD